MQFNKYFLSFILTVSVLFSGQKNIQAFVGSTNFHQKTFSKTIQKSDIFSYSESIENDGEDNDYFLDEEIDNEDDHFLYLHDYKHVQNNFSFVEKDSNPKKWYKNNTHLLLNKVRRYILFCSLKLDYNSIA